MLRRQVRSATSILKVWKKIHAPSVCFHQKFEKKKPENHYDVLGVPLFASEKEIKEAFIELSKKYHPDSDSTDQTLHEKYVKISAAYNVLSSAAEKEIYDEGLKAGLDDFEKVSKQKSEAPKSTDPEPQYYEHPDFYEDEEMKMKAAKFWEKNTGFSQERAKYPLDLNKMDNQAVRRIVLASILLSLGVTILMYQWLRATFNEPSSRSKNTLYVPKSPTRTGTLGRARHQDISENYDPEMTKAGQSVYLDEKELKT